MTRYSHPGRHHVHADNGTRQVIIVVVAIASVLGLGAFATDQYLTIAKRQSEGTFETASGNAIYTGSMLYVPDTGNVCHQWQFDNRSGQMSDKGTINCEDAAGQELNGAKNWSTARIRVIRDGFRAH
jgi:hypothetical protein